MNVNGKAGSLEMYLGKDLLMANDELVPIEGAPTCKGRDKLPGRDRSRYKRCIRKEFERKVDTARRDPAMLPKQDWSGVTANLETIVSTFD
jgi:hypothetical protein